MWPQGVSFLIILAPSSIKSKLRLWDGGNHYSSYINRHALVDRGQRRTGHILYLSVNAHSVFYDLWNYRYTENMENSQNALYIFPIIHVSRLLRENELNDNIITIFCFITVESFILFKKVNDIIMLSSDVFLR